MVSRYSGIKMAQMVRTRIPRWTVWLADNWAQGRLDMQTTALALQDTLRGPFELVHTSRHARVYRAEFTQGGRALPVYIKFYLRRYLRDLLLDMIGIGRAARAMRASFMLAEAGFLSPPVAACCQRSRFCRAGEFVLVTEGIEGPSVFDAFFHADPLCRKDLLEQLGTCIGQLHKAGIAHGDLRPGNLLVCREGNTAAFYFLDNERTRKYPALPMRLRLKNLVQLNLHHQGISRTERMRFFRAYMRENSTLDKKTLLPAIVRQTTRRRKKKGLL